MQHMNIADAAAAAATPARSRPVPPPRTLQARPGLARTRARLRRAGFWLLAGAAAAVFFSVVSHHVWRQDFRPLAALCLPVLLGLFAFTSLLYMRGRSLARGREQARTLFAAEQSMRGTIAYLCGILLGTSVLGLIRSLGLVLDPQQPSLSALWLLLFLAPYGLMQAGLLSFMAGVWTIVPQFLRPVDHRETWRRIGSEPAAPRGSGGPPPAAARNAYSAAATACSSRLPARARFSARRSSHSFTSP